MKKLIVFTLLFIMFNNIQNTYAFSFKEALNETKMFFVKKNISISLPKFMNMDDIKKYFDSLKRGKKDDVNPDILNKKTSSQQSNDDEM